MACPVCGVPAQGGMSLSSGEVVHSECFQNLTRDVASRERNLAAARARVTALRAKAARRQTQLGRMFRFLNRADPAELKDRIQAAEEGLRVARVAQESATEVELRVFDLMLDYPPDWERRSVEVAARDVVCKTCGSSRGPLQAHHVVRLSRGGTNRLDNLKLLCESCHRREHGGKDFAGPRSGVPLAIADRVQLLTNAIRSGDDVVFLYRKPEDKSHRKRRVTPKELVEIAHVQDNGRTLCLKAYCHARQADRTFALKRMRGLKYAKD